MAQSRSLVLAIAVNALLVGVLLYSVALSGTRSGNLSAPVRSPCAFQKFVNKGLYRQLPANLQRSVKAQAFLSNPDMVPDMNKRTIMNALTVGAVGLPALSTIGPYLYYFYPPQTGGGGGAIGALDAIGNPVTTESWFKTHKKNARDLVQGIKGDPTYLIVNDDGASLNSYGLNAVCTHLGCVVPWVGNDNKFKCPCHGSQYAADGHVVRGPAPRPLALAHVIDNNGKIELAPWTETDFRTGEKPWWV